jgi:hypothetical protein
MLMKRIWTNWSRKNSICVTYSLLNYINVPLKSINNNNHSEGNQVLFFSNFIHYKKRFSTYIIIQLFKWQLLSPNYYALIYLKS